MRTNVRCRRNDPNRRRTTVISIESFANGTVFRQKEENFAFSGGVKGLVEFINRNKTVLHPTIFYATGEKEKYNVRIKSSSANQRELPSLLSVINGTIAQIENVSVAKESIANITTEKVEGRPYKLIDFKLAFVIAIVALAWLYCFISTLFKAQIYLEKRW